jgi:hypothetical protein
VAVCLVFSVYWPCIGVGCVSAVAIGVLADWVIELCVKCREFGLVEP